MDKKSVSIDEIIGKAMGERPEISWPVMNASESAYCISFDFKPEADEWLADQAKRFPVHIQENGYHVVRFETWPDYLGAYSESGSISRFINFAMRTLMAKDSELMSEVMRLFSRGETVQRALFIVMFGDQVDTLSVS